VLYALKQAKVEDAKTREIVEQLKAREADEKESKGADGPKAKSQYVIVANGDRSFGWAIVMPEDAAPQSVLDRINAASHAFNMSKRGKKHPVKTVGESLESTSRKFFKNEGLQVKNKLMVPIIVTDNKLGEAPSV
jgi:hypothetical protein